MNAVELIVEVSDVVLEPDISDEDILKYLNRGQLDIANKILLPGLAGGNSTVSTVTDDYSVPLPSDFHRGLFLVQIDDEELRVVNSIRDIVSLIGVLKVEAGSVLAVATHTSNLIYQMVPSEAKDIELFYHRKPVAMTTIDTSFPDGLTKTGGQDESLEQALIFFACWKCFAHVEQGLEGAKPDTNKYLGLYLDAVNDLNLLCHREGISYQKPAPNKVW